MSSGRKTLLLTGASRGIGHATVQRFSTAGWRVITTSREDVPAECKRDPNWTHHLSADLADPAGVQRFVAEAAEAIGHGPLDALVNAPDESPQRQTHERVGCLNGDIADWRAVFQLNL